MAPLTKEELKEIVEEGILKALSDPKLHCRYSTPPDLHQKQHEQLAIFLDTMNKIQGVKWDIAKRVLSWVAIGVVIIFGYGIFYKVKMLLGG